MIFVLGFLFAGLAALAFAPAFWRRANQLTRRRLEMQVPLSVEEILAERDQLRAEFAVEQRRLELRTAQVNRAHAADRSELGRRAAEIGALKDELAQRTWENRASEQMLVQAEADLSQAAAELGAATKALYDAEGLYERRQGDLIELTRAHETMTNLAEERLANHAAAEARSVALELRLADVSRILLETEKRLAEQIAQSSKFNDELGDALVLAKRNLEHSEGNCSALQKKLEVEAAHATEVTWELEDLRAKRDEDQEKLRSLAAAIGTHEAAVEDLKRREASLREQRDQQVEKLRDAERALAEKYDRLQSEHAGSQDALDAARRRCEALEADLSASRSGRQKRPLAELEETPRQDSKEIGTIVRLPLATAEASPNGGGSEASPETETPVLHVVSPAAAEATSEPAEQREVRDQVGT